MRQPDPEAELEWFRDRSEAGRLLGEALRDYAGRSDVLVLGLPRGGVPVAFEVADRLGADLDVMLVRKLGYPGHEELAVGAIASGGVRVLNDQISIPEAELEAISREETIELQRREQAYRGDRPDINLEGRCVILVDDGLATGATMSAAVLGIRQKFPSRVVVAVPVAPAETVARLRESADHVVCLLTPEPFFGVGQFYADFSQTSDEQVRSLLEQSWRRSVRRIAASDDARERSGEAKANPIRGVSGES
jgi:predicted phosphoribosyltransferase